MRLSTTPFFLLPTLAFASPPVSPGSQQQPPHTPADVPQEATTAISVLASSPTPEPIWVPLYTLYDLPVATPEPNSEMKRQAVQNPGQAQAATAATQMSPVTTIYQWGTVNGVGQEMTIVYTQSFAEVPQQWPSPSSGSIGYGTINPTTKGKRDVEPTEAPVAEVISKREEVVEVLTVEKREEQNTKREENSATTVTVVSRAGAGSALALAIAVAAMIAF